MLIFPSLAAGNIAHKLVQELAHAEAVGPILVGMRKPVHVLQRGNEVKDIVNLAAMAVVEAQQLAAARLSAAPDGLGLYPPLERTTVQELAGAHA